MYAHRLLPSVNYIHQGSCPARGGHTSHVRLERIHIRKTVSDLGTLVSSVDLKILQHLDHLSPSPISLLSGTQLRIPHPFFDLLR